MEFTRQPIIETVITAKEGFKLVVRSSKNASQEEYFVDAVEVVSFGNAFFFRSTEKPKAFLAPVTDYEVLEVREARMVLKNVGLDRAIKIGGGKETLMKAVKEQPERISEESNQGPQQERPTDRKRDRRRGLRRRRDREDGQKETAPEEMSPQQEPTHEEPMVLSEDRPKIDLPEPKKIGRRGRQAAMELSSNVLKSLLTPPPNLISDTIEKYRDDDLFKGVFISKEAELEQAQAEAEGQISEYMVANEEQEEAIFRQRVVDKEHENENYSDGIEEGSSAIVESFKEESISSEDYQETPQENFREDEPESKF